MSQRILAVCRMWGLSPSGAGPVDSALKRRFPPTPREGRTATKSTTIPTPPSHCVVARQSRRPCGMASMSSRIVAPVVVRPLIASKKQAVKEPSEGSRSSGSPIWLQTQ